MTNNITTNAQYSIHTFKTESFGSYISPKKKYTLIFSPNDRYNGNYADLFMGKEDFANIARAVLTLNSTHLPISKALRKKYFTGCNYDGDLDVFTSGEPSFIENNFTINVEKQHNEVIPGLCGTFLYKLSFCYNTVFGNKDTFTIVLREKDFVNLGILACKILDGEPDGYDIG